MAIVQNQGLRKFILPEGTILPKETMQLDDERAKKLCAEYEDDFAILQIQEPKKVEVISEEEAEKLESGEKVDLEELTRDELIEYCEKTGIDYSKNFNKKTLIKVIKEAEEENV